MNLHYVFKTKQAADSASNRVFQNMLAWHLANNPDAISQDGKCIRSRNFATGEYVDALITGWCSAWQRANGDWVVIVPTDAKAAPVPAAIAALDPGTPTEEYQGSWEKPLP